MTHIAVPKHAKLGQGFSSKERLKADEDPGRPWNRVAGGWMADLAALKKFVMLCPFCRPKFNPKRCGYEVWRQDTHSIGKCDGCKQMSTYLCGFIHQEYHDTVGEWQRHPRKGRWARRSN